MHLEELVQSMCLEMEKKGGVEKWVDSPWDGKNRDESV